MLAIAGQGLPSHILIRNSGTNSFTWIKRILSRLYFDFCQFCYRSGAYICLPAQIKFPHLQIGLKLPKFLSLTHINIPRRLLCQNSLWKPPIIANQQNSKKKESPVLLDFQTVSATINCSFGVYQ
jgi:hypothetical protein